MKDFMNKSNNYKDWFNPEFVSNEEISKIKKDYWILFNWRTNKIQHKKDNFLSNQKSTFYSETNRNRLDREIELGFKFSCMGADIRNTFTSPKLIDYDYTYYFDLGNSTYENYMGKYVNDLTSDTEIQIIGYLELDTNKEIGETTKFFQYTRKSLYDYPTKSVSSGDGEYKDKFLQKTRNKRIIK